MITKCYLLDTSIILDDTQNIIFLWQNAQNQLFICDVVIEELDKKKDLQNETGYFAREFFRCINSDNLSKGGSKGDKIATIAKENNDFIQEILFKFENYSIPLFLIYRPRYKLPPQEHSYNDSKLIEIAKDYNLTFLPCLLMTFHSKSALKPKGFPHNRFLEIESKIQAILIFGIPLKCIKTRL